MIYRAQPHRARTLISFICAHNPAYFFLCKTYLRSPFLIVHHGPKNTRPKT